MAKYSFEQKPGESIENYYRRIAKVADQRLVRLEKLAGQPGYGNATQWAYRRAASDIETWGGNIEKPRFNTKPPENINALRAKINDIKAFLGSESSTKSGITETYKNRASTINSKYGTSFQVDDLAKVFNNGLMKKLEVKGFSSKTILKAIGYIQDNATDEDALKAMQAEARKRKYVPEFSGDPFVDDAVRSMLRSKTTIAEMYSYFKSF